MLSIVVETELSLGSMLVEEVSFLLGLLASVNLSCISAASRKVSRRLRWA